MNLAHQVRGLRGITSSVAFYPVSMVYVVATLIVWAVASDVVRFDAALVLLGLVALLMVVVSMRREVSNVHTLVNSQHDELVTSNERMAKRIDQLVSALRFAKVKVPHDDAGVDPHD